MASKINLLITWCELQIKAGRSIGETNDDEFHFFCLLKEKLEVLFAFLDNRMKVGVSMKKEEINDFLRVYGGKVAEKHINIVRKYLKED